jgi:eukaryotic-like serine/threonine-protein kinase
VNLGAVLALLGKNAEAETLLKRSLALKPTSRAYSNLGTLYYQSRRYAESVSMFEKAVESDGGSNYFSLGNLADACLRAPGQGEKAQPAYLRAIALAERQLAVNPKDATVLHRLAGYRAHAGQKPQAVIDIRLARKLAPADVPVILKTVLVYEIAGHRTDALGALEELLKRGQDLQQVEREPDLDRLRQDPGYQRLAARYARVEGSNAQSK